MLVRSLATGTFEPLNALELPLRRIVAARLRPMPDRAARFASQSRLTFAEVWPEIRLVTTWTGGSCGIALLRLRAMLPAAAAVMELGYQSTEVRGTIALTAETAAGLPPLHHHFFEFVEQSAWDEGRPTFLTLGELESQRTYYVIVTTASGLYRYFMNDLVQVTARFEHTPLLRFVQKGRGVTSLTGEKLYEAQAIDSVACAASRCGFVSRFFVMVAEEESSVYRLFLETGDPTHPAAHTVAEQVDRRLGELNIEYHGKRASGRLEPLDVVWLKPGAGEAYKRSCVRAGQREGQFKPVVLHYRKDLRFAFDEYVSA
jgi:hypothetical protein